MLIQAERREKNSERRKKKENRKMVNANKDTSSQGKPYLPVDVQSVELVGTKELEGVVHEAVHAELVFGELLEGLGTERPASEGQHDLKGDGYLLRLLRDVLPFLSLSL